MAARDPLLVGLSKLPEAYYRLHGPAGHKSRYEDPAIEKLAEVPKLQVVDGEHIRPAAARNHSTRGVAVDFTLDAGSPQIIEVQVSAVPDARSAVWMTQRGSSSIPGRLSIGIEPVVDGGVITALRFIRADPSVDLAAVYYLAYFCAGVKAQRGIDDVSPSSAFVHIPMAIDRTLGMTTDSAGGSVYNQNDYYRVRPLSDSQLEVADLDPLDMGNQANWQVIEHDRVDQRLEITQPRALIAARFRLKLRARLSEPPISDELKAGDLIGRYTVLRKLATGGMAEIFLARHEGPKGFSKLVVVKRVLAGLEQTARFVEMFLDEGRLSAQLSHPNIAQTFELGEHQGRFHLAMEYVSGESLGKVVKRAKSDGQTITRGPLVRIGIQVLEALQYVHGLKGERGEWLKVVHRDVSPSNVIVSYQGHVKLLDFGIARSASHQHHTQTGLVKGKGGYMSPEQATAGAIDQRTDVYAVGALLYLLSTGIGQPDRDDAGGHHRPLPAPVRTQPRCRSAPRADDPQGDGDRTIGSLPDRDRDARGPRALRDQPTAVFEPARAGDADDPAVP